MKVANTPRRVVDAAITGYQRHISPRKGYRCARGALHGDQTCSAAVRGIIRERGVIRGIRPSVMRFVACYQAAALLKLVPGEVRGVCCCGPLPIPFRF